MYFFVDFFRLGAACWSAAPTSGYCRVTTEYIDDSDACVDGGDMSPLDFVSAAGSPATTFVAPAPVASGCRDVDATAFVCTGGYLGLAGCLPARTSTRAGCSWCFRISFRVVGAEVDGTTRTSESVGPVGKTGIGWRAGIRCAAPVVARAGGGGGGGDGGGEGIEA